jgi:hypothetical protein
LLDAGRLHDVEVVADLEEVAHGGELLVGEPGEGRTGSSVNGW